MPEKVLLDTNIIADFFNNIPEAVDLIMGLSPRRAAISVITYTEVLAGFEDPQQEHNFDLLRERLLYFSIELSTARMAADLKRNHHWKLPDAYQAAIAIEHKMTLLTRDTKDFNPSEHKFVKIPYKLHHH